MTGPTGFDRTLSDWLEQAGAQDVPPRVAAAAKAEARHTRRARPLPPFLARWLPMSTTFAGALPLLVGRSRHTHWAFLLMALLSVAFTAGAMLVGWTLLRSDAAVVLPPMIGPAGNGLIAYSRDGDIFLGDPATGVQTPILTGPAFDTDPTFSPDGSHIAFVRFVTEWDEDSTVPPNEIHVVRPDGSGERAIEGARSLDLGPEGSLRAFAWTPDSAGIVVSHHGGDMLTWFDPSGRAGPVLLTPPLPRHPSQFPYLGEEDVAGFFRPPRGDRILSADWEGGPPLAAIDPDGANVEVLIERSWMIEKDYRRVDNASWSPDASRIALSVKVDPLGHCCDFESYVMDAHGSHPRRLPGDAPSWSPDSSKIAVVRPSVPMDNGEPGYRITIVDVASGTERELDGTFWGEPPVWAGASWSPDGRSLLLNQYPGTRMITVAVETGDTTELPWETNDWPPSSRPSWQRVAIDR